MKAILSVSVAADSQDEIVKIVRTSGKSTRIKSINGVQFSDDGTVLTPIPAK